MAIKDSLVSYWRLDESSGNATDSHGSNTLTNYNTTAYAAGKINNGADFEYTLNNALEIADGTQSGLDITSDISFSFWYKPETTTSGTGINTFVAKNADDLSDKAYWLFFNGTGSMILRISDDGSSTEDYTWTSISFSNGTNYHIVITWKASTSTANFYIDNSSQGSKTGSKTSLNNSARAFRLGSSSRTTNDYRTDGIIDEFGIWSKELSSAEVSTLYNSGSGLSYPFNSKPGNFFAIM